MHFDKLIRPSVGADNDLSRNNRGLVNVCGTPVGPDVSRPAPIDRPGGNSLPTRMNVLKLMIAPTADLSATVGMFQYPDYFVTCHKVPNNPEGRTCDGNPHLELAGNQ